MMQNREVSLRRWEPEDAETFFFFFYDPALHAMMNPDFPKTADACRQAVCRFVSCPDEEAYIRAVLIDGCVAGCIAAFPDGDSAELAYWLALPYRGRGLMPGLLISFAGLLFRRFPALERLHAAPLPQNYASHRALEKAGFRRDGTEWSFSRPSQEGVLP